LQSLDKVLEESSQVYEDMRISLQNSVGRHLCKKASSIRSAILTEY